jgi:hypothetical protein
MVLAACGGDDQPFEIDVVVEEGVPEDVPVDVPSTAVPTKRPPTSTPVPTPVPLDTGNILDIAFAAESMLVNGAKIDVWEINQRGSVIYVLVDLSSADIGDEELDQFYGWMEHLLGLIWAASPYSDVIVGGLALSSGVGPDGDVQYYVIFGSLAWARTTIANFFLDPNRQMLALGASGRFESTNIILLPDNTYEELRGFDYEAQKQILIDQLLSDAADSR